MARRDLPQTLTPGEVEALMARPNTAAPTGLRNLAILTLMHRCGLRVGEVCGLHLRDVRWSETQIHLRTEVAKGGREAFVPFGDQVEQLLERWRDVRRRELRARGVKGAVHLFTSLKGRALPRQYVWEMTQRYARRAGIEHAVHPHMLRHTYATELLREGFNIREVQELLRHADVRTTQIYTEVAQAELVQKIRARR